MKTHTAKLTAAQVLAIRKAYTSSDTTQAALAQKYGVHQVNIGCIVRGESWSEVGGPIVVSRGRPRIHAKVVRAIREAYAKGNITQKQLARRYGVQQSCISDIVLGDTWPEVGGPIKVSKKHKSRLRLTAIIVREIREAYATGTKTQAWLAQRYGVQQSCISYIIRGETWKRAGGPVTGGG
jgi:predicted transcriptional regulator